MPARIHYAAIRRAEDAWDHIQPDDVDELGGLCTFNQTKTIYYAADALAWLPTEAGAAENYAQRAIEAYADESGPDWAFGDQAGSRSDPAIARIAAGELEGATEAVAPILDLDPEHRINGVPPPMKDEHMPQAVQLTGDLVAIREFDKADMADVHSVVGDHRATDWLSYDSRDLDEAHAMVERIIGFAQEEPRADFSLWDSTASAPP